MPHASSVSAKLLSVTAEYAQFRADVEKMQDRQEKREDKLEADRDRWRLIADRLAAELRRATPHVLLARSPGCTGCEVLAEYDKAAKGEP
jgi:fructoselysine-6-P-deglycase FrlB-like protein